MKEGKLFSKVNFLDVLAIIFLILLIAVLVVRTGWFSTPEELVRQNGEKPEMIDTAQYEKVDCLVTVRFKSVSSYVLDDPFVEGDKVLCSNNEIGQISQVSRTPTTATLALEDGTAVTAERGTAYDYYVKIPMELYRKDNALRLYNNTVVAVGQSLTLSTEYYYGKATVTGVKKFQ
ncbi:MAG: DUF4330 family protein [Clostridia bacterium]|nr:DUF4330 family protein [Clostridia bacterium]